MSAKVTNSTDNILISALVGTLTVGVYTNYSMVMTAVKQLSVQISGGIAGSLGNLFATERGEHCAKTLNKMTFVFFMIASSMSVCISCCITPFIRVWLGDRWVIGETVVFLCSINLFMDFCKIPLWQALEVSGLFRKDKNISIIGSTVNLIISIVLGQFWGIEGIFIGTIATYVIQIVLKIRLLYGDLFHYSSKKYYLRWGIYTFLTIGEMIGAYLICRIIPLDGILDFVVKALIGAFLSFGVNIIVFCGTSDMKYAFNIFKSIFFKKSFTKKSA